MDCKSVYVEEQRVIVNGVCLTENNSSVTAIPDPS